MLVKEYPYAHVCVCVSVCVCYILSSQCMMNEKCRFILFLYFIIVTCRYDDLISMSNVFVFCFNNNNLFACLVACLYEDVCIF